MVRVSDIRSWLNDYAPFRYAASWDRCGLQVGDPHAPVEDVLVALDPTSRTLAEAKRYRCQCLVTHHPLIFQPLEALTTDTFPARLVIAALQADIHVIAAHTNLDAAVDGTNDQLARVVGLADTEPFETDAAWTGEQRYGGMARIGLLPRPLPLGDWVQRICTGLGGGVVRVVGDRTREIRRAAVCAGSGGSLVERVIATDCEAYVTGDLKYHEAQRAMEAGLAVVDVGHFASERLIVEPLAAFLRSRAAREQVSLTIRVALDETDPFWYVGPSED